MQDGTTNTKIYYVIPKGHGNKKLKGPFILADKNKINYLKSHVVTTKNMPPILSKLNVRDRGYNLSEERPSTRRFLFLKSVSFKR